MKFNIFLVVILFTIKNILSEDIVVRTPLGDVLGSLLHTPGWRDYYAFQGIRYAEPPVGELRWKPAVPVKSWNETFDARKTGPWCHQHSAYFASLNISFSEDCLRINVATHNLNSTEDKLLPVIVDIHGGSFTVGGSGYVFLKPTYMMKHDIVHVSFNYRLGVMGFLSTGTAELPGNLGLKDQTLALKWVKENIKYFGGDPDNVTLMGFSAGASSVTGHIVSPMSTGLFHRAVAMSGSMTNHFLLFTEPRLDLLEKIANNFECSYNKSSISATIDCLRNSDAQLLEEFHDTIYDNEVCPPVTLGPILEGDFGQERFFIEQPTKSVASGNFNKVPIITGIVKDEFIGIAHFLLFNETLREKLENNFYEIAPLCFTYEENTNQSRHITDVIRQNFISSFQNNTESMIGLQKPFGDAYIGHPVHRNVQLLNTQVNVYYYKFSYMGTVSEFYYPEGIVYGVEHGDDQMYIFDSPLRPLITSSDPEYKTVQRMSRLITNFAENGNPNRANDAVIGNIEWRPFNKNHQNYLNIGDELEMESCLFLDRFRIWDELFPI